MVRAIVAAYLLISLVQLSGCNRTGYRVVQRTDVYVDKNGHRVSDVYYSDISYDHEVVQLVLTHSGHKIHAECDLTTVDKMDKEATCGLRPLRTYACVIGKDNGWKDAGPLSDLTCKDAQGHNVYLYVSKEE